MATQGPNNASSVTNVAGIGTIAWTNPGNATVVDTIYATCGLLDTEISNYLWAANFGFSIPDGASITNIEVGIRRKSGSTAITDHIVKLIIDGVVSGTNKAAVGNWGNSDATATYSGDPSSYWGVAVTPALVNNANFGVALSVTSSIDTASVDALGLLTITYTGGGVAVVGKKLIQSITRRTPLTIPGIPKLLRAS